MTNSDFFEQVRSVFTDLAEKFKFSVVNPYDYTVELINRSCKITFVYDRGETSCMFSNPKSGKETRYHAYRVYRQLYPGDDVFRDAPVYAPVPEMLRYYHELVLNRLQAVLSGDFSWSDDADAEDSKWEKKIKFVISNFPPDHPIKQKFWNGDPSWQQDLEDYRKEHSGFSSGISNFLRKIYYLFIARTAGDK